MDGSDEYPNGLYVKMNAIASTRADNGAPILGMEWATEKAEKAETAGKAIN